MPGSSRPRRSATLALISATEASGFRRSTAVLKRAAAWLKRAYMRSAASSASAPSYHPLDASRTSRATAPAASRSSLHGLRFGVQGLGFRVEVLGFRVKGLGCGV